MTVTADVTYPDGSTGESIEYPDLTAAVADLDESYREGYILGFTLDVR